MSYKEFDPNKLYYCFDVNRCMSKHICFGKDIKHNPFSCYELTTSVCGLDLCTSDSEPIEEDPIKTVMICIDCRNFWKTYDLQRL